MTGIPDAAGVGDFVSADVFAVVVVDHQFSRRKGISSICRDERFPLCHAEILWCFRAYISKPALVVILNLSIMLYLWKATVPGVMSRISATSFMARRSLNSCNIRLSRGLVP